jgi:RES domain-containing protein
MPTSGAGAAAKGGRFNRPGIEAVYLSFDVATALAEYKQDKPFIPPGTLASFTAKAVVADVGAYLQDPTGWNPLWADWNCNWRSLWFDQHIQPPSWDLGDIVIAAGLGGSRFPSAMNPGGWNVVLYPSAFDPADGLACVDPDALLKNVRRAAPDRPPS